MSLAQPGPAGVRFAPDDDRNAGEHDGSSWLSGLVASVEPAVVFSSLASVSVPMLADACLVTVAEDDDVAYRIGVPSAPDPATPDWERGRPAAPGRPTRAARCGAHPDHRHTLGPRTRPRLPRGRRASVARPAPSHPHRSGRYPADRAHRRRSDHPRTPQPANTPTATNRPAPAIAVETNREIGAAIGILMATQQLNQTQAFDALRAESQHSHRKLRDVASDVVFTGTLAPRPPTSALTQAYDPAGRRDQRGRSGGFRPSTASGII